MDRVLDRLWIGDSRDFRAPLGALGFSGVLDLRDGHHGDARHLGVLVHRVENRDGDPWNKKQVGEALDFVSENVRRGRVLIACAAGMSRSVCMTVGYLVRCGMSETEAWGLVCAARVVAAPVPKMLESVLKAVRS
jgi:predicted protein tyrosine phosphatase